MITDILGISVFSISQTHYSVKYNAIINTKFYL